MGATIAIRAANESDLEPVRLLLRETWHQVYDAILGPDGVAEVTGRWHAPALLREQLHQPHSTFLVAQRGKDLVGHGFAFPREPATLVISRLYVRPGWQRQGIGSKLFAALTGPYPGAATLWLFVAEANPRGLAFWRREGFSVVAHAIEEGAPVVHMEKRLR